VEYCHHETFRPECWKNEVVVIQEAIYGRRRAGRCTKAENSDLAEDPRYLGCHADVLGLLNAKCSGKKECELRIPDPDLDQTPPCVKSLRMFLEVRYTCVDGVYNKLLFAFKARQTRMWANAQCDGRPAEYRWRPVLNAAKFG